MTSFFHSTFASFSSKVPEGDERYPYRKKKRANEREKRAIQEIHMNFQSRSHPHISSGPLSEHAELLESMLLPRSEKLHKKFLPQTFTSRHPSSSSFTLSPSLPHGSPSSSFLLQQKFFFLPSPEQKRSAIGEKKKLDEKCLRRPFRLRKNSSLSLLAADGFPASEEISAEMRGGDLQIRIKVYRSQFLCRGWVLKEQHCKQQWKWRRHTGRIYGVRKR